MKFVSTYILISIFLLSPMRKLLGSLVCTAQFSIPQLASQPLVCFLQLVQVDEVFLHGVKNDYKIIIFGSIKLHIKNAHHFDDLISSILHKKHFVIKILHCNYCLDRYTHVKLRQTILNEYGNSKTGKNSSNYRIAMFASTSKCILYFSLYFSSFFFANE